MIRVHPFSIIIFLSSVFPLSVFVCLFFSFFLFKMSKVSQANLKGSTIETQQNHPSGELQNIQAAYRLNGKNYLQWS